MALREHRERIDDTAVRFKSSLEEKIRHLRRMMESVDARRQKLASSCAAEEQVLKRRCAADIRKYQLQANEELERRVSEAAKREGWNL